MPILIFNPGANFGHHPLEQLFLTVGNKNIVPSMNLSFCSPVRYRNAFKVDLRSSLIFSEDLLRKNASASSTNKIKPFLDVDAQSKT